MNERYPWALLVRHAAGRATPHEVEQVAAWSAERPEHAHMARRVERLVSLSQAADGARDADRAWGRLQHRLHEMVREAERPRVLPVPPLVSLAAISVRRSRWRAQAMVGLAASALVAAGLAATWRWHGQQPPAMREVATRRGERLELGLPDGSHVVLGADSRLRFRASHFARARTLDLDGEAYFTVAHDTRHPFVVRARDAAVQAVGTEFGVRGYADDTVVQVAVARGRVLLRPVAGGVSTGAVLTRGDLGLLDGGGRATVQHDVNLDLYLGWVSGRLVYDMAPATTIARDLERWYDLSIIIDDSARRALDVTMTIDPRQPAALALERLAEVLDLRVVQTGRHVHLARRAVRTP